MEMEESKASSEDGTELVHDDAPRVNERSYGVRSLIVLPFDSSPRLPNLSPCTINLL
jgi:hypothetical protein